MARTRAATYDAQRQFILEAAAEAFAELGFPSASMNDIARRCGVSKGLLYHYYASKEQLLFDVTEQYTKRLVALVEEAERRVQDPARRLPELIRLFLEEYQTSQARHMVLLHDLRFLPDAERRIVVGNQRRVIESFAEAIRAAHGLPTGPSDREAGDDDAVRHDELDVHLAEARQGRVVRRVRRAGRRGIRRGRRRPRAQTRATRRRRRRPGS